MSLEKILNEQYLWKNIEVETEDGDYYTAEVYIKDSVIKHYIDIKYNAKEIIRLAQIITGDEDIKDNDLDLAYDTLIDFYFDSDEYTQFDTPEEEELYDYLDEKVHDDYEDEAYEDYLEQDAVNKEIEAMENELREKPL